MAVASTELRYWFSDDRLHIAGRGNVLAIQPWDVPEALLKRGDAAWSRLYPARRLVEPVRRKRRPTAKNALQLDLGLEVPATQPGGLLTQKRALELFRFKLPKRLARGIEKFRSHQWHLIQCGWWFSDALYELLESNPALAYTLVNSRPFIGAIRKSNPVCNLGRYWSASAR